MTDDDNDDDDDDDDVGPYALTWIYLVKMHDRETIWHREHVSVSPDAFAHP